MPALRGEADIATKLLEVERFAVDHHSRTPFAVVPACKDVVTHRADVLHTENLKVNYFWNYNTKHSIYQDKKKGPGVGPSERLKHESDVLQQHDVPRRAHGEAGKRGHLRSVRGDLVGCGSRAPCDSCGR